MLRRTGLSSEFCERDPCPRLSSRRGNEISGTEKTFIYNHIIELKNCNATLKHAEQTYMDIMHQIFLLIDFVGFNAVLLCQSEDAVLGGSNVCAS